MSEDSINTFYGGTVAFSDDLSYEEEKSIEHRELVKDRLGWLVGFEYTPKEIRERTEEFLEDLKGRELSNGEQWNEVVGRWVKIIMPLANEVREGSTRKFSKKNNLC